MQVHLSQHPPASSSWSYERGCTQGVCAWCVLWVKEPDLNRRVTRGGRTLDREGNREFIGN